MQVNFLACAGTSFGSIFRPKLKADVADTTIDIKQVTAEKIKEARYDNEDAIYRTLKRVEEINNLRYNSREFHTTEIDFDPVYYKGIYEKPNTYEIIYDGGEPKYRLELFYDKKDAKMSKDKENVGTQVRRLMDNQTGRIIAEYKLDWDNSKGEALKYAVEYFGDKYELPLYSFVKDCENSTEIEKVYDLDAHRLLQRTINNKTSTYYPNGETLTQETQHGDKIELETFAQGSHTPFETSVIDEKESVNYKTYLYEKNWIYGREYFRLLMHKLS